MNENLKSDFIRKWKKYFNNAELPLTFYYTDNPDNDTSIPEAGKRHCLICDLKQVRDGKSLAFNEGSLTCTGAKRYLGYSAGMRPGFEYFLSCGIAGKMEGERYIRTPEMVLELMKNQKRISPPGKYIVFKRWDKLNNMDNPDVVIFFAEPDVLSGLFTLANFDQSEPNGTFAPFGSGCGSIVHYPYLEISAGRPRAVIGMFDPSARPCVPAGVISFSIPMKRFEKMIGYMDESFLITNTWKTVRKRIK